MAKKEYFDSWKTRWFFRLVGCIPVNRGVKDDTSKQQAIEILHNKGAIGIFPEGTRNKTKEKLLPFKYGAVSMAIKTKAKIIPYAIKGKYEFRSKNLKIKFGEPLTLNGLTIEEANQKLYNTINNLLDEI